MRIESKVAVTFENGIKVSSEVETSIAASWVKVPLGPKKP
jgi:hypothetical protein